jgi:hypothetical protein
MQLNFALNFTSRYDCFRRITLQQQASRLRGLMLNSMNLTQHVDLAYFACDRIRHDVPLFPAWGLLCGVRCGCLDVNNSNEILVDAKRNR